MSEHASISTQLLELGSVIAGRYKLEQLIGSGGMATVYLARDNQQNNLQVALKVLHKEFAGDKHHLERFIREVRVMSKLDHPNIAHPYEIFAQDGLVFFSMEFIRGESLERLMDTRTFSALEIADITKQICEGLGAVHAQGIVHRDLKPGNVMLTADGQVKLLDFGVAREESSRLTRENQKVGSICYIAPEIWLGKKPTPATDFYGLGVVLYELATGRVPFEDTFPGAVMRMHLDDAVKPPQELNPKVPHWLDVLTMRLLEKSPNKRPRIAKEICEFIAPYCSQANETGRLHERVTTEDTRSPEVLRTPNPNAPRRGKTYVFTVSATKLLDDASLRDASTPRRRKTNVVIPLPKHAAVVFEFETPSRDFIYFGIFLASLQIFDGILTSMGMARHGTHMEGNPLLRAMFHQFGTIETLVWVKLVAVLMVVMLTVMAKRMRFIKDIIGALSCLYLVAAIIPWLYILLVSSLPEFSQG